MARRLEYVLAIERDEEDPTTLTEEECESMSKDQLMSILSKRGTNVLFRFACFCVFCS